ncbi:MAG: sulfatase-like hydrolase/transferase [Planctomycetota bacterium]|jgi:arylsulfatase A-like enzyme|nr:sulfatase-like hydrolase/transferase [Planctomycetota bacterium]
MKTLLTTGFALLAGCSVIALIDGCFQFSSPQVLLRRELMGFALIGAWAAAVPAYLMLLVLAKCLKDVGHVAFWVGIAIGLAPLLMAWIPSPYNFFAAALLSGIGYFPISKHFTPVGPVRVCFTLFCMGFVAISPFLPSSATSLTPNTYVAASDPRPIPTGIDVFLISIDTLRADVIVDDPNLEGDSTAPLPFLQGKIGESMWATYALSCSNQTLPGHVGMLTGVDAMEHGVRSNIDLPDPSLPLVSEVFQEAGWNTAAVISNALISSATGMHRGFDIFSDKPIGLAVYSELISTTVAPHTWLGMFVSPDSAGRLFAGIFAREMVKVKAIPFADRVTDVVMPQLDAFYNNERPFFYFIHMLDPHVAYGPPPHIRGVLSNGAAAAVPERFLPNNQAKISFEMVRDLEHALQHDEISAEVAAATLEYYRLVYLEEMIHVDNKLKEIFARADASKRPYVVLFTGDHGEQFGEHDFMEHANSMFQKNLEVPFMVWGKGVTPGELQGTIPGVDDVPATLLHLAGIESPQGMAGRSMLLPPLVRPFVATDNRQIAVYDGTGMKWIGNWTKENEDSDGFVEATALFDLNADPTEGTNLLLKDPDAANSILPLIGTYVDRDTWAGRQTGIERSAFQQAAFDQLGYVE